MPKKKQKLQLTDSIGQFNLFASALALFTLFFGIFNADGLEVILYPLPFLIAFAISAYIAEARFLGRTSSKAMNVFMIIIPAGVIVLSIRGIVSVL